MLIRCFAVGITRCSTCAAPMPILEQLKNQILSGQLASGTQLTSVRDLSAHLKVNPMTVSKVYSMLETEGLVERRPGIGLFVADGALRGDRTRLALLERSLHEGGELFDTADQHLQYVAAFQLHFDWKYARAFLER